MAYVNKNMTLPEVFEETRKLKSVDEKVEYLMNFKAKPLMWIINFIYNVDKSKLYIPDYKNEQNQGAVSYSNISNVYKKLELAVVLMQKGDERRYVRAMQQILESVSKEEAKLIEDIFNDKKIEGISKNVWKRVFPEFFRPKESTPSV